MARVTVEDCLKKVKNRFDLILKASKRSHQLELGAADPTVPRDNDKPTVIALREIAAGNDITQTRTEHDVDVDLVEFDMLDEHQPADDVLVEIDADMEAALAAELAANLESQLAEEFGDNKEEES